MTDAVTPAAYAVLARKYRPTNFDDLIGQDALVRTLTNAIEADRVAHAFMLAGVRGVGKTTTARIIARALNCVGRDGGGGVTARPCGECDHCRAIAEDRHVDVLEVDAASHTGVDKMREIIDSVRYAPASARHKVYIIDEVHMLSQQAFNALLKTLEEPPPHVTFVFATTEIRKVPVTVLSRCQRFDLRRIGAAALTDHLSAVAERERISVERDALALITRAAEGSVRDALSLLDQAAAHGGGGVSAGAVREMLGLADNARILDLLERLLGGDVATALAMLREQYDAGADPVVVLQSLLSLAHWLTRLKVVPDGEQGVAEEERVRGREMATRLSMPALTRCWQILLKGLAETRDAPEPLAATEMVLVRVAYAAGLPSPANLVGRIADTESDPGGPVAPRSQNGEGDRASAAPTASAGSDSPPPPSASSPDDSLGVTSEPPSPSPADFRAVANLVKAKKEMRLYASLMSDVCLVSFEPGRIALRLGDSAPTDLPRRLGALLQRWTGERWLVATSGERGAPSLGAQDAAADNDRRAAVARHPLVARVLEEFPGAEIDGIRDLAPAGDLDGANLEDEKTDEKPRPDDEAGAGDAVQDGEAPG